MRILYYSEEYFCNHGGRTHAREFFNALSRLPKVEHAAVFGGGDYKNSPKNEVKKRAQNIFLPLGLANFVKGIKPRTQLTDRIIGELRQGRFDVLVARKGFFNVLYSKIKRTFPQIIICVEINALRFEEHYTNIAFRPFWQNMEVQLLRSADCFTVVSSYLKKYLVERKISENRIMVNPNGVNVNLFKGVDQRERATMRALLGVPENAFVLGYVGGMEPFRRLPEVIDSVGKLRDSGEQDLYLLIIGDGKDLPEVQKTIRKNKKSLDGGISMLGWQPYEQIPKLMAAFDIAIFPFTNPYCSPLKLFEYLAMGLPTIGPDIPAVREILTNEEHLLLVSQDGDNFHDCIMKFKKLPITRNKIAEAGEKFVKNNFTWKENALRLLHHVDVFATALSFGRDR